MMELLMDYDYDDTITKQDIYAIAVSLAVAFFIGLGLGEDSFGVMLAVGVSTYCGIRYLQSKGLL